MEYLFYVIAVINVVLCAMMGIDKLCAKLGKRRIPEKVLFLFAVLGGALGGTVGMLSFRHKTKHWYFAVGFPALAILQIALLIFYLSKNM
ncbi:MAG: DUF1294 domain-containing protein [Oscillospiraceae bacterium]|nr:DUF1294 domain-containing protein [Oscillospiraceae bacterium]